MNPFPIPVVTAPRFGPGSQPQDGEALDYAPLPPMEPLVMPRVPEVGDGAAMAAAADVVDCVVAAIAGGGGDGGTRVELSQIAPPMLEVLNECLGQGEVSIVVRHDGTAAAPLARIQETAFPGLWRELRFDRDGTPVGDALEVGDIPALVRAIAASGVVERFEIAPPPPGVMNAPALLHEIALRVRELAPGAERHVMNLTLLPFTPEDHAYLEAHLADGPVTILSRGFGNCRIALTGLRGTWRVQYFNSMQTLILNTIEIGDLPEVALAAPEDIAESARRLRELVAWMREDA